MNLMTNFFKSLVFLELNSFYFSPCIKFSLLGKINYAKIAEIKIKAKI